MAFADIPRYRRLAEKVRWLQRVASFSCLWVREDGAVLAEQPDNGAASILNKCGRIPPLRLRA